MVKLICSLAQRTVEKGQGIMKNHRKKAPAELGLKRTVREFPGGAVVRTTLSNCQGPQVQSPVGKQDPTSHTVWPKVWPRLGEARAAGLPCQPTLFSTTVHGKQASTAPVTARLHSFQPAKYRPALCPHYRHAGRKRTGKKGPEHPGCSQVEQSENFTFYLVHAAGLKHL